MSRMLRVFFVGSLVGSLCWPGAFAAKAQSPKRPSARQTAEGDDERDEQPAANAPKVEPVSKELQAVLEAWALASSKIIRLQGDHQRFVYDTVFQVEKRADGKFYYESPDKGRIDITPTKIAKGGASGRKDPKTGKPYKLESDRQERWVCTGVEIVQINDTEKSYDVFPIPPQHRGANIMEGPMPFLFGMPAEKAKKRYALTLKGQTDTEVRLKAIPRWQSDAANYREAEIILDAKKYLPRAVRLIDPSGNLETVYAFGDIKVNQPFVNWIGLNENPLKPQIPKTYKPVVHEAPVANAGGPNVPAPPGGRGADGEKGRQPLPHEKPDRVAEQPQPITPPGGTLPSVVGFHWENAKAILEKSGYVVKYKRGQPAAADKLVYVVYDQTPKARTALPKGETVYLTLYDKQAVAGAPGSAEKK